VSVQETLKKANTFIISSNSLIVAMNRAFNGIKKVVLTGSVEFEFRVGDYNIHLFTSTIKVNGNFFPGNYEDTLKAENTVSIDVVIALASKIDYIIEAALKEWGNGISSEVKNCLEPLSDTTFISNL
jgi:hypothetical protein